MMKFSVPFKSETDCYEAGFDCGLYGSNIENCHFSFFSTPEKTKQWEAGKRAGERKLSICKEPKP